MRIIPYKMTSGSAKAIADALGVLRVRGEGPAINLHGQTLINWGCSAITRTITNTTILNRPESIQNAINKLNAFRILEELDVEVPEFSTDISDARSWINDGRKVVCRQKLSSYGGDGIVIAETVDQLVEAPLYVRYMPKEHEYRIHVFRDNAFFVQRKARKLEVPDDQVNWQVRNLEGGFIYANQDVEVPQEAKQLAIDAVRHLGLDFGAVDVLVTPRGKYFFLEVNTACGLSGTTLEKYVEVFRGLSQNR